MQEISINHVKLANLKLQDFQTRKLIDIFEVNPADYNVSDKDTNFILTIQTADYDLWKRYRIESKFNQMVPWIAMVSEPNTACGND